MSGVRVAGFEVVELLGYGSGGEVWLAREQATGEPVALKRLRQEADLAARDRLRREAAVLAGVHHPHVVRLRSVVTDQESGGLVLVLDLAAGGSLARLLAGRRCLPAGEVVTLGVPLAQALAAVHAQGLVHGDVTPANVLFAGDGRPLLSDLGVARLLGTPSADAFGTRGFLDPAVAAGRDPEPATDVHGLAATCVAAVTGVPPYDDHGRRRATPPVPGVAAAALLAAVQPALVPEPGDRPTAEELAVAVFDAAPAEPVRLATPGTGARAPVTAVAPTHRVRVERPPDRSGRAEAARRATPARARVAVVLAVSVLGVALALTAGLAWAGAGEAPRAAVAPGAQRAPSWVATLAALDDARSRAFAAADPALLRDVYAADAPALRRDRAVLERLAGAGLRAEGVRLRTTRVGLRSRSGRRAQLAVTDVMPPYRLVDAAGGVVERRPGRGARSWTVVLDREQGEWRVYDVVRG